jgi:ribonuclease VapC
MIVDTSAALAVVLGEPGFEVFASAISASGSGRISAASFLEASIVAEVRAGARGVRQFDSFMRESGLAVEPVTHEHALIAREGFSNYGKGRHSAGLNFGDCFAYALAKSTGEPLLFRGEDFRQTDVVPAL